jgi:hypothetical protein
MEKLAKFEKFQLTESKLRFVTGGTRYTTYQGKSGNEDDFVDNCGWTAYDDCRDKTADGLDLKSPSTPTNNI